MGLLLPLNDIGTKGLQIINFTFLKIMNIAVF